jgi:transcriptional regulator with XRE-family HTH domain
MKTNIGNKEVFGNNLAYYVERSGKSQRELADLLGVASSTFNDWVKGRKYPRIDKIEMLANIFGILKSDLIEERTEEHREMQKKNNAQADIVLRMQRDEQFFQVVNAIHEMDPEKLSGLLAFLK